MTRRGNGYKNLKTVDRDTMNRIVHCIWRIQSAQVPHPARTMEVLNTTSSHSDFLLSFSIYQCNWKPKYNDTTDGLIMKKKKKLNKYQSRGLLWKTWIRLSPDVKAMKNKERYGSITIKCSLRRHGL